MLVLHLEQRQEEDTLQVANDISVLRKAILVYTYVILFYIPYIIFIYLLQLEQQQERYRYIISHIMFYIDISCYHCDKQ